MRITWVTRSFLDYRIPVYAALDELCGHELTVIYYADVVPSRASDKLKAIIGDRAIGLTGEWRLTGKQNQPLSEAKRQGVRIPLQPGLIRRISRSNPEVLITDGFFQWTYAALWLRMLGKAKHVMCYEPTMYTERNAQWFRRVYRKLARHWIDAVCCNGQLCREYTRTLGFADEVLFMGNMAADSDQLTRQASRLETSQIEELKQRLALQGTVFLYVGRLVPLKGLRQLLLAWKCWSKENPLDKATLLLVGDGSERVNLETYCREQYLNNVVFAGAQDYDHLPCYYRSADVFVIPTLQDNWSLVVPEAMACGLPIVCSKYNGCHPELVSPENGWVFDPLDEKDTVRVLQEVIVNAQRLPVMGVVSKSIVENHTPRCAALSIYKACQTTRKKEI